MVKSTGWKLCAKYNDTSNLIFGKRYYPLKGEGKTSRLKRRKAKLPGAYNRLYKEIQSNVRIFNKMYHAKSSQINPSAKEILRGNNEGTLHIFLDVLLNEIIPNAFYGPIKHKRCMKRLLTLMFTRSRNECIHTSYIYYGFDFDKVPWLESVRDVKKRKHFLHLGIKRVLSKIVAPLFRKLYYPLYSKKNYNIKFIPTNLWKSYIQRVTQMLILSKQIIYEEQIPNEETRVIGALNIIPKNGLGDVNNFRAYVRADPKRNCLTKHEKSRINKLLYNLSRSLCPISVCRFQEHWKRYVNFIQNQQIYGVKLDVTDCFGNVDLDVLIKVISDRDNEIPLNIKQYLVKKINNQYVQFGMENGAIGKRPRIYKWNHGLIQGEKFSAPLCEVYMSYMDSLHLKKFSRKGCFLQRKVDDYFFCSSDREEVLDFIRTVSSYMIINEQKTQSNVNGDFSEVEYCGYLINLKGREIRKQYKFEKNAQMHHKFKIWNLVENMGPKCMLTRTMYYPYNNHHFSKILLNLHYNSVMTVYENYFSAMVYLAFKFDCAVMAAFTRKVSLENFNLLQEIISSTVLYYASKAMKIINDHNVKWNYFVNIGYNAFLLVLRKRQTPVYKDIVKDIVELQTYNALPDFLWFRMHSLPKEFENISMKRVVSKFSTF